MSSSGTDSESIHVKSHTENTSRHITRKNQTRRSLNAMEKQAGDLYCFLSELEEHKSAGPQKLKEFLESSEHSEKSSSKPSSLLRVKSSRQSVQDRMKQLAESNSAIQSNKPEKQDSGLRTTPKPPTRSDSMKRLKEIARAKYTINSTLGETPAGTSSNMGRLSPKEILPGVTEESVSETCAAQKEKDYNGSKNNNKVPIIDVKFSISDGSQLFVETDIAKDFCTEELTTEVNASPVEVSTTPSSMINSKSSFVEIASISSTEKIEMKNVAENHKKQELASGGKFQSRTRRRGRKPNLLPKPEISSDGATNANVAPKSSNDSDCLPVKSDNMIVMDKNASKSANFSASIKSKYNSDVSPWKVFSHANSEVVKNTEVKVSEEMQKLCSEEGSGQRRRSNENSNTTSINSSCSTNEEDSKESPVRVNI